ncbi:MAG: Cof-type HAD-IIB family hydrolase [Synergistaceae bacterium]|nr:Cof-type HAD-IIB family hydrolase [Synergistaceae bacterium]
MHKYKLVAFDLDETLLRPDSSLSEYAVDVLRAIDKSGVKVVPCTGRPHAGTLSHLRRIGLDTPGVFCNGAQLRTSLSGKIMDECPLPLDDARAVIRIGLEMEGHPRVYMDDRVYVSHITEEDKGYAKRTGSVMEAVGDLFAFLSKTPNKAPLKIINLMPNAESIPAIFEKSSRFFKEKVYVTQSLPTFIEYMHTGATKGKGLKKLADRWGFSKEEILVAGDHFNDLTMFAEAGFSIAPQNAQAPVREAASCVCLGNAEDGVVKKLAEIFEVS